MTLLQNIRDAVGLPRNATRIAADYDRVADEYVQHVYNELEGKPFDRHFLGRFAEEVGEGRVCDIGCGPGHVARYLYEQGCDVFGVDISPRMIELARTLNPHIEFRRADLWSLDSVENDLAGIVAFYSLVHLEPRQLLPALTGLRRALRPGGRLAVAVHEGNEKQQPGEMWGIRVDLQFNFFTEAQFRAALEESGFIVEDITHRAPYLDVEIATDRMYFSSVSGEAR